MLSALSAISSISYPSGGHPVVATAAAVLRARGGIATQAADAPGSGLRLDVSGGPWPPPEALPNDLPAAWLWARITEEGDGELRASHPSLLYAFVHLICDGLLDDRQHALGDGELLEVSFPFHRPVYDHVLSQVSRSARGFNPEPYIELLARSGFTHVEVNGLAAHIPFEPGVQGEYYNQFYSYCAGFNHFVDSRLTRGLYPAEYLQSNLNRLRRIAEIGRSYGLKPGMLCFEPRSLPEQFFQQYPTLRGARVDHPFRSHHPRYTLAQDHPVAREHYREVMHNMMEAVPDLSYLSVWSNDSGAGFEHTSSLYVGRNGGPYLIREWRNHDEIATTAGKSVLRWLRLMQESAAKVNPDFEVLLRIEPFKVEHDTLMDGMGEGISIEAPSLLVRGYDLPYEHPKYPEQTSAAGSIFHIRMDEGERRLLAEHRGRGFEPKINYSPSAAFNMEPLLGVPFPRMLHQKLIGLRESGFRAVSAFGGLLHVEKTPYWPHPEIIRAAQFTPEVRVEDVLARLAERWTGAEYAAELVDGWDAVGDIVEHLPIVPLYSNFGFVWLRTWVRPLVPDIEAIPTEDRLYYERFLVSTANNPNINDLGRDVLFVLLTEESGRRIADQFDANVLPRFDAVLSRLDGLLSEVRDDEARSVFTDLRDRTLALQCWATTQRNTCAWVAGVYRFLSAETVGEREAQEAYLQEMIDLDLDNTRRLLNLWENCSTETILVSEVGETSFIYGENFGDLLRRKLQLTERYRTATPRIDRDIIWRLPR